MMGLDSSPVVYVTIVTFIVYVGVWVLRAYLCPLASIPNAGILAPLSRLFWAFPTEHRGRITLDLPLLHKKYGPLIRIGPNELSFYSMEIYKTVHAVQSPFIKDPRIYGQFVQDELPGLFSITDPYVHAQRRRLMGQLFNRSKMNLLEGMMTEKISAFVAVLGRHSTRPIELVRACRALEADIVSEFGFGEEIGALAAWDAGEELDMVKENDDKSKDIAFLSNLPTLANMSHQIQSYIFSLTGWETPSSAAMKKFDLWSSTRLTQLTSSKSSPHPNFISTMIRSNLPAQCALSEAKEMLGPGTDTTSATLAHILFALAHDTDFQTQLATDLEAAAWPTNMTALESVPRLRAAVKEGVRWAGAAAAMLPRVVPADGATLAGVFVPGGTVITSSPIWYLHDDIAFPDPKRYRPGRWIGEDELRDEFYIPFSKGSGACIGAHFAYLELYLSVSMVLREFEISLPYAEAGTGSIEAILPERLEWVAAVPSVRMDVFLSRR